MAEIIQTLGGSIVLPDYARPDLAFTDYVYPASQSRTVTLERVDGRYLDVLLHCQFDMQTNSQSGTRVATVQVVDQTGNPVITLGVSPFPQPASEVATYVFSTGYSSNSAAAGGSETLVTAALPCVFAYGGQSFTITGPQPIGAGEYIAVSSALILHIPTGPQARTVQSVAASPVLV